MAALAKAVKQDAGSLLKKGHKKMERLTIPDEKIDGGMKRTCVDGREVKKYAMTLYWALKKYEDTGLTPEQVNELKERYTKKKPDENGCPEKTHYKCPNCEYISLTIYADGYCLGNMPNYCEQCGQKIDWSEVENGREES
jgi:hypothetical protein